MLARAIPAPDRRESAAEFRPRALLRYVVATALTFWFSVLLALVRNPGAPDSAFMGAMFFVGLFTACWVYYHHLAIAVEGELLILRGFLGERGVRLDDILQVNVHPGLVSTTYDVIARGGYVRFSSLFARHQELKDLIVRSANLGPRGR